MAGNQMPVLTLDVNEEQLKRLEAIFEKYQNGLKIGPGGFPVNIPPQTSTGRSGAGSFSVPSSAGRKSDSQFVSNYNGRGETMFDKYLSGLGKNAQATLKTYKQINSTLRTTTSRINNLFKTTVVWGTRLTAMGIAGPFGFGMMARNVVEKQKNADELQATPGELKAAESTYSPYFSGVGNLLNTLAAAQNDTQHPAYSGLIGLGIDPKKGAAENLPVLLERVAALAKEYEGTGLTQSMLRGRNLGWVNFGIANQLVKYQDKIPELNKEFLLRASQNDSLLTSGHTSQYQNLTSNLENNWDRLTSGFQGAMARNAPSLLGISNGLTNSLLNFMNGENFKRILTDVETGLDKLGKYINGPDFNNDLNNFAENVAKVAKALGGFVGFAAEHPWLFGAAVIAGGSGAFTGVASAVVTAMMRHPLISAAMAYGAYAYKDHENIIASANSSWDYTKRNVGDALRWIGIDTDLGRKNTVQGTPEIAMDIPGVATVNGLQGMVREKARAALLPENLLETVIGIESGWNPNAISEKGAMGLLQFIKSTGNAYKLYGKDFFDPDKSTDAGVNYFLDNSSRYQGDIAKMLAQYNGGNIAVGKDNTLRLKLESVNYLLKALEGIPELRTQRPMLEGKLQAAKQVLASNPDGRAIIQLEILEKPGASYLAQLAGQLIPR
ncbi:transglycosylase SLT domain-containing protein [Citrobacter sedlakii]|uniref:transglycosylase SLT domain-containing protein n=1 Tax=Citrobacter sedlakii TaxID=67826 RepID=UPI0022B2DACD|nr:transglycosylase SLT domain-containing protein [Citrobacter sedlakii]MCZ4675993.1 transglycosylase SLT domain-containing protein [Citrobacter sedlakii]MDR5006048.1 transglycosylase SLT domain-containing protein [Citrobacter sedlakii]